jgi:hypothetical protein
MSAVPYILVVDLTDTLNASQGLDPDLTKGSAFIGFIMAATLV